MSTAPDPSDLARRLALGERAGIARAITLIESRKAEHRVLAARLLELILPRTGRAHRIGITGVPGVGKSTLIDAFGSHLTGLGLKVAVLAVDPSSTRTGGSILGDKTRMARLAVDARAFVRPSPSSGTLGGVAARTRETILVCEAAGFDVILVETVGIGQSETVVADMTDVFLALMLPGAGDELQGIKKGVLEIADIIAVNKADGDGARGAARAAAEYRAALQIMTPAHAAWRTPVLQISGLTGLGLDLLWETLSTHRVTMERTGAFAERRRRQQVNWMWAMIEQRLDARLKSDPEIRRRLPGIEAAVASGARDATGAADEIAAMIGL